MRIQHLSAGTMCPFGGAWTGGSGGPWNTAKMVCHCLLIETKGGLVLVDTGLGLDDLKDARARLGSGFLLATRPRRDESETAIRRIEALGYSPRDVRHLIVTHMDLDHAGGLPDFPEATVHLLAAEHEAALRPRTFMEKERYKRAHLAHGPAFRTYEPEGEKWNGFDCVRQLEGLPPEILLVPLAGHTRGHAAVAVQSNGGWLVHAGDAYFNRNEMLPTDPSCPLALAMFQRLVATDSAKMKANKARLRELANDPSANAKVFSAHDPVELEQMSGQ